MKRRLIIVFVAFLVMSILASACSPSPQAPAVTEPEIKEPAEAPEEKEPVTIKWSGWMLNEWEKKVTNLF